MPARHRDGPEERQAPVGRSLRGAFLFRLRATPPPAVARHDRRRRDRRRQLLLLAEGDCLRDQALVLCGAAEKAAGADVRATSLETLAIWLTRARVRRLRRCSPSLDRRQSDRLEGLRIVGPAASGRQARPPAERAPSRGDRRAGGVRSRASAKEALAASLRGRREEARMRNQPGALENDGLGL